MWLWIEIMTTRSRSFKCVSRHGCRYGREWAGASYPFQLIHVQAQTKAQAWKVVHYFWWWFPSVRPYKTHRSKSETIFQASALVGAWVWIIQRMTQVLFNIYLLPRKERKKPLHLDYFIFKDKRRKLFK